MATKRTGRTYMVTSIRVETNLSEMADIVGINRTALFNTKLAEHFDLPPYSSSFVDDRILSPDEEARLQSLRAQYLLLGTKSGFSLTSASDEELEATMRTVRAEQERRKIITGKDAVVA